MLQNPQVASMLTPFHHAAAMQAAALHHAAASQNNASVGGTPPAETSLFNTSLNPTNNIRDHHSNQQPLTGAPHLPPLGGGVRVSPPGSIPPQHPQKELPHPHGTHLPPQTNPHPHPNSLPSMGPPHSAGGGHPHIPPGHFLPHPHHNHLHPHHPHLGLEPPKPRFMFKMPRVVPNQKEKYESDDLMKRHSREGEVRINVFLQCDHISSLKCLFALFIDCYDFGFNFCIKYCIYIFAEMYLVALKNLFKNLS